MTRVAAAGIWCYLTYMYYSTPNMEVTASGQQPETHIPGHRVNPAGPVMNPKR